MASANTIIFPGLSYALLKIFSYLELSSVQLIKVLTVMIIIPPYFSRLPLSVDTQFKLID
jgi:hypothetical protein